ncbi:PRC-barrel domain-containing protein [Streptomyces ficellus]|uniref:PRC-barrel domain-containing protein n=1 Tax=Streptomyces ficellus TaxID=1977088 RepID=UPI003EBC1F11
MASIYAEPCSGYAASTDHDFRQALDHPVYDAEGTKIGEAKHVFLDDVTGRPEWVSVKTGMFGTSESFVPIKDATVVEDHLEVPYAKDKVKDAPNVGVDSGGHLSEDEEYRLYEHYGSPATSAGPHSHYRRDAVGRCAWCRWRLTTGRVWWPWTAYNAACRARGL